MDYTVYFNSNCLCLTYFNIHVHIYPLNILLHYYKTQITGLPKEAEPILRIQLSSPIEEQVITKLFDPLDSPPSSSDHPTATPKPGPSCAVFRGVDTSVATLLVKAWDKDIPLGSSALYDVKPLCEVDVLGGVLKKVTFLDVAIVPDSVESQGRDDVVAVTAAADAVEDDVVVDDDNNVDEEDKEQRVVVEEEFQDAKSEVPSVQEQEEDVTEDDGEDEGGDEDQVGEEKDAETLENSEQAITSNAEAVEQEETSWNESSKKTDNINDDVKQQEMTAPLLPICTVHFRVEYNSSIQEQKDELYSLLDKASKRKALAVDQLRKSASALNRASSGPADVSVSKKQDKATIKPGFLKKNAATSAAAVKKEFFLIRWYRNTLGPDSLLRAVFPIAKNYILFFGGVALMHFQGQQLALPPPV